MSVLNGVPVDLTVVLGSVDLPIRQILKLNRGSMIPLNGSHEDPTLVYVNDQLVAKGQILVEGEVMSLEVLEVMQKAR